MYTNHDKMNNMYMLSNSLTYNFRHRVAWPQRIGTLSSSVGHTGSGCTSTRSRRAPWRSLWGRSTYVVLQDIFSVY